MIGAATCALAVDLSAGEPPSRLHPTVRMGRWITSGRERRKARGEIGALLEGAWVVATGAGIAGAIAALADTLLTDAHPFARGLALKPAMSLRALLDAGRRVQRALDRGDLEQARRRLGRDLVSRDTSRLTAAEVAGAAVESIAENFCDSVVAPLIAFRVGGLAGAYIYRMVNTADAMIGYHSAELEWFGKAAARADDALNLVPARAAAAMIALCAPIGGGSPRRAGRVALRDAFHTSSPNAGWPMAAMAGALGIRLTKRGHYILNRGARDAVATDIGRSIRIVFAASLLAAIAVDAV